MCADCGVNRGSVPMRVRDDRRGWHTVTLCGSCLDARLEDGARVEDEADAYARHVEAMTDRQLADR